MYHAIVFLPLLGFLIAGLFGSSLGAKACEYITSGFLVVAAVLSWIAFISYGLGEGEAFTLPVLRFIQAFDIDNEKINVNGGAIALGHPLGATGARLVGKCATLLHRENKRYGLATQCMGGGMGIAMVLEAA